MIREIQKKQDQVSQTKALETLLLEHHENVIFNTFKQNSITTITFVLATFIFQM